MAGLGVPPRPPTLPLRGGAAMVDAARRLGVTPARWCCGDTYSRGCRWFRNALDRGGEGLTDPMTFGH